MQRRTLADPYTVPACHGSLSHAPSRFLSLSSSLTEKETKSGILWKKKKKCSFLTLSCFISLSSVCLSLLHTKQCVCQVQFLDSLPEDKQVINYIPSFFLFAGLQTPSKRSPGVSQTKGFQDYLMSRLLFLNGMPWCEIEKNFKRPTFTYNEIHAVKNSTIARHNKLHAEVHTLRKFCKGFHDLLCKSLVNGL